MRESMAKARGNNKSSGLLGAYRRGKNWQAQIKHCGKLIRIGVFSTPEMAHSAYLEAKRELHCFSTI